MFSGVIKKTPLLSRFIKEFLPKEPKLAEPGVKDLPWGADWFLTMAPKYFFAEMMMFNRASAGWTKTRLNKVYF